MNPRQLALAVWVIGSLLAFSGCKSSPTSPNTPSTQYTLTVTASLSNGGTVAKSPNQTQYTSGTVVTLTATPASGFLFTRWEGDVTGTANPATVTMNANRSVTAVFTATATQYTLTVTASPSNGGTVAKSPNQAQYASGTVVTLTATPASGYQFTRWEGDVTGTANPATVTMNANKTVAAVFAATSTQYTLTITASPSNGGTVAKSPNQALYTSGTVVTLTATPASSYQFTRWEGDVTGTANPATVTMNADKTVTAVFTASGTQYTLTVSASPSNGGTITKSPDQAQYASGTVVTLTANPASGYAFFYWDGDLSGQINPLQLIMNTNKTVTALFRDLTAAIIQLSPTSLSFSATQGGSAPAPQMISITNAGSSVLSNLYCTFPDGQPGWLTTTPIGRTAPTTVTAQVVMTDPSGAPYGPGTYTTRIAISSSGASNSPQYVTVTLTISPSTGLTAYASYDNVVMMSTSIPSWATTVFPNTDLVVGYDFYTKGDSTYDYLTAVSLIKFNVQPQIAGRNIARATLRLYVYALRGEFGFTPRIRLDALSNDWNPGTLTWNTWQSLQHYTSGQVTMYAPNSGVLPLDFDVTTIVRNWASGTFNNYGVQLFPLDHFYPGWSSFQATHFQSLETWYEISRRPQLIVEFQ